MIFSKITKRKPIALSFTVAIGLIGFYMFFEKNLKNVATPITPALETYISNEDELCKADGENVIISPHGSFAVFDQDISREYSAVPSGNRLNVLDINCAINQNSFQGCLTGISSIAGVRVLGWETNDKSLFVIENNKNLIKIDFSENVKRGEIVDQTPLHSRETALTVLRIGSTESSSVQEENDKLENLRLKALTHSNMNEVVNVFLKSNAEVGAIFEDSEDLHLYTVINGFKQDLKTKWREVPSAQMAFHPLTANKSVVMAAKGAFFESFSDSFKSIDDLPFSRPVISSTDGTVVGFFNKTKLLMNTDSEFSARIQASIKKNLTNKKYIQSIGVSEGGVHGQIIKSSNGSKNLSVVTPNGIAEKNCFPTEIDSLNTTVNYISIGSSEWPLHGLLMSPSQSKGLVVFFGGGPLSNVDEPPFSMRQYLRLNWSVLAVNYSGSIGSGTEVSERLYNKGLKDSIWTDSVLISNYLKKEYDKANIIIHGESFGALPAISLDAVLDSTKEIILVAPFLKHQPPEFWADKKFKEKSLIGSVNIDFQKKFEKAFLGFDFDKNQLEILDYKRNDSRTLIIFAKNDLMSTYEQVPPSWRGNNLDIDYVPGGHEFSTAQPRTWEIIKKWIE